jgi:hypothetical protein
MSLFIDARDGRDIVRALRMSCALYASVGVHIRRLSDAEDRYGITILLHLDTRQNERCIPRTPSVDP